MIKKISIIGLGKLGAPLAACFASKNFEVVAVDNDPEKVKALNEGTAPVFEPDLQPLITAHRSRLRATFDYEDAILNSETTFIIVPTPSDEQGGFSLQCVLEAGKKIAASLKKKKNYHLVVLTSTVLPGSTENELKPLLESESGKKCGEDFGLCYSPEFIALGSVIRDFLNPDFLLIGESDARAGEALQNLYQKVCENHPPVARMNFMNAELAKLAVNTYVTTKITYANTLARLCEKLPGADVDVVASALGMDSRIGKKYLKGAIGYGGPCFPRDNQALIRFARSLGVSPLVAESTDTFNREQIAWLANLVKRHLPPKGRAGILGLTYKPHSDVVEEAQGILLAQYLSRENVPVVVYDPVGLKNAKLILNNSTVFAASIDDCIRQSDVLVIATPWEEFKCLSSLAVHSRKNPVIVDCWRLLKGAEFQKGVKYIPLGKGGNDGF